MEYVLHIGMMKTGSTSLQNAFFDNREALLRHGVIYPETGLGAEDGTNTYIRHLKLRILLNGRSPKQIDMPEDWVERFRKETADWCICVISDEELFRISESELLLSLFPRGQTRVVIYLREPITHVASRYANQVRVGNLSMGIQNFAKFVRWSNISILDKWSKIYGQENIVLRRYDRECLLEGDIVADFANLVRPGLADAFSNLKYETWPSIAGNLLFIKRVLNCFINIKESNSISKEVTNIAEIDPNFRGKVPIDQETVNLITNQFREDFEAIEKRYGLSIQPHSKPLEGPALPDHSLLASDFHRIQAEARKGLGGSGELAVLMERMKCMFDY